MGRIVTAALLLLAAILPAGCAEKKLAPLPQRTVLFYDYVGAWAATAGNECEESVDLSDGVFIAIGPDPAGGRGRFYAEYFFMLDPADRAEAAVARIAADGRLDLTIEADGTVDGRPAQVTYKLTLQPKDFSHILVTGFGMTVIDASGIDSSGTRSLDLLQNPELAKRIPVLATAGSGGLCLRRM